MTRIFRGLCFKPQHPIAQVALRTDIPTSPSKSENLNMTTWTAGHVFPEVKSHMTLFFDYSEKSKGKWQTSWFLTNKLWKWLLWNWPALSKFAKNVGALCSADFPVQTRGGLMHEGETRAVPTGSHRGVGDGGDSAVASPKEIWTPREKMNFPY